MSAAARIRSRPDIYGYETAAALADLIDEFKAHDTAYPVCHHAEECWDAVAQKIEALEAVIERTIPEPVSS